ncbi:MAG: FkbM family methyltransferase, partial [Calothrix sp. SM1_7_51]|nr:FkbM family methyltransferase [Calothrix sp. SM1_7_51]
MTRKSNFIERLNFLVSCIERPQLFKIRKTGGIPDTFIKLDQPWLHEINIATILDIGANIGQFSSTISSVFPQANIYAFEPLPDCFQELQARMSNCKNFTAINVALGDNSGILKFERNNFSLSSSFLKMTDIHKTAFPETQQSQSVEVKVEKLDDIVKNLYIVDPVIIKIDVQGYEDKVLKGGEETIKRAKLVISETSFESLYEGQPLFDDIYRKFIDLGFQYAGSFEQLCNPA